MKSSRPSGGLDSLLDGLSAPASDGLNSPRKGAILQGSREVRQMVEGRKLSPGLRFWLAVLLIGTAGAVPAASPALANHSRGATYTGTHTAGGTFEFNVSADGSAVTRFHVTNVPGDTCDFTFWTTTGTFPIGSAAPHTFSYQPGVAMSFTGTFHSTQSAQGTFEINDTSPPACRTATISWTATTATPWDTTAPGDPALSSTSHAPGARSRDNTVDVTWSGATDDWSGVDGFSYIFDQSATTVPDTTKDAEETTTSTTSSPLADGRWYFHLRTRDNGGNWTSTAHLGPFLIDTKCRVPNVKGKSLRAARAALARGGCRLGKISRAYSAKVNKGRVISQKPRPGARLPKRGKVNLVVSRGRKR